MKLFCCFVVVVVVVVVVVRTIIVDRFFFFFFYPLCFFSDFFHSFYIKTKSSFFSPSVGYLECES